MNLCRMSRFSPWLVPGLLWLWLFTHLRVEWTLNPQYNYGWGVPFLALLLFYLRWLRRPAPDIGARSNAMITVSLAFTLALLFPIRIIEEANPDWRLLSWILALCVIDFSLLSLLRAGGAGWLKHFAFPVCFPLAAVPWPVQFENFVVQTMMRAVAYVAVEITGWFGVGAYQLGNVIQLRNGFVGVDEACSGVKTLQAGIMVALVLGELLRLGWSRRVALLVFGCGWVFVCNVFRATTLVFVAAHSGLGRTAWCPMVDIFRALEAAARSASTCAKPFAGDLPACGRPHFSSDPARCECGGRTCFAGFSLLRVRAERPAVIRFRLHPGRQAPGG